MKKYIVKFFKESPFDKSDYIKDVQILCDVETGEPYAHLDSPYDWVGHIIQEDEISAQWSSKKSKHLVPGDQVVFGAGKSLCGTIDKIDEVDEGTGHHDNEWDDDFYLIDCYNKYKDSDLFEIFNEEIPATNKVKRRDLECKGWLYAKITNDDVNWKKIEKDWSDFYFKEAEKPNVTETINWFKERVKPIKANNY